MKRILEDGVASTSKRVKSNSPFHVLGVDMTRNIAKYLAGDYLKNFKLTCKTFNEIAIKQSCAIEITKENFQRTATTPGYHIIKLDNLELIEYLICDLIYDNKVKKLIVDYCGIESRINLQRITILTFTGLESLRIIRSIGDIPLYVYDCHALNSLEIYTTGCIVLVLYKKLEKALLCSTEEAIDDDYINIRIHMPFEKSITYSFAIKCYAKNHEIQYITESGDSVANSLETFVPNPLYLV